MGYYIETPSSKHKVEYLCINHHALLIDSHTAGDIARQPDGDIAAICVVDNGPFEAAAILVDYREFKAFDNPHDGRPKTWLALNKSTVFQLTKYPQDIFHGG